MSLGEVSRSNIESKQQESRTEIYQTVQKLYTFVEQDPSAVDHTANMYEFVDRYKEKGIDLPGLYSKLPETSKRDEVVEKFAHGVSNDHIASLAETLPLLANEQGRLGDWVTATVTKTARPDDQGNSFIDLVVTLENDWLTQPGAPKEARDVPKRMTFLVDVTSNEEAVAWKRKKLREHFLDKGKQANVLCYEGRLGDLGIDRPKILVAKTREYMEHVGVTLGRSVAQHASDSFSITNPEKFNRLYREYFLEFVQSIKDNATQNIAYLKTLPMTTANVALMKEYEKIVTFTSLYEKTPTQRDTRDGVRVQSDKA
jgi:hypothetical protein